MDTGGADGCRPALPRDGLQQRLGQPSPADRLRARVRDGLTTTFASHYSARGSLDNALKGAERAAALTQRLLAFSRQQPLNLRNRTECWAQPRRLSIQKLT